MTIKKQFDDLIGEMSDDEFWNYIRTWLDEQFVMDIMKDWDDELKKDAIKEIKQMRKNGTLKILDDCDHCGKGDCPNCKI